VYDNLKKAALQEILAGCRVYRNKGLVVLGGDLNARCGCNGDPVINKYGRDLSKGCAEESMCIVNELDELCHGEFTRVQDVVVEGVKHTRKTTLDYVLVPLQQQGRVLDLVIDDKSGLDSDHRPVRVSVRWNHGPSRPVKMPPARVRWRLSSMKPRDWSDFSRACETEMTPIAVAGNPADEELWSPWKRTLLATSTRVIGKKRVFPNSKPWFDSEARMLRAERLAAGVAVVASGTDREAARLKLDQLKRKWRATSKRKRMVHREKTFRNIEQAQGDGGVFAKLWKSHTRTVAGRTGVADAVLNAEGSVVCDSTGVLKAWRAYAERLGRADDIDAAEGVWGEGDHISSANVTLTTILHDKSYKK
jgi:hypothetical protein